MIQRDIETDCGSSCYPEPDEWKVEKEESPKNVEAARQEILLLNATIIGQIYKVMTGSGPDKLLESIEQLRDIALRNLKG